MYSNHSFKKDSGKKVLARFSEIESHDDDGRQPAVIARELILAWARSKNPVESCRRFTDNSQNLRRASDWSH
jgi:hypothetical protein